jgi:hypothetical protein
MKNTPEYYEKLALAFLDQCDHYSVDSAASKKCIAAAGVYAQLCTAAAIARGK